MLQFFQHSLTFDDVFVISLYFFWLFEPTNEIFSLYFFEVSKHYFCCFKFPYWTKVWFIKWLPTSKQKRNTSFFGTISYYWISI